jgi:EmrB/QacA subfamily drug resistance transporter
LGGRAADLLGRRRVFVSGLLLFALSSLLGGLANSQGVLIAARAIQGLGGAIIAPASLAILTSTFEEGAARNRAVGAWGAMGAAGGSAGVLLGGIITDVLGWRWILFINVPIGVIAALLTERYVAEGRAEGGTRGFDLAGAVTATLGLSLLVFGIVRTDVTGWGSASTLAVMGGGLALLGVFVWIEGSVAKAPLMPLRIYRSRTLSAANVIVLLLGAAVFGMWFFVSLYVQQVLGFTPIQAGLAFLPMTLSIALFSVLASRLVRRFGAKRMLLAGMSLQTIGLLLFTDVSAGGSYLGNVLAPSVIVATGMGMAFVPVTLTAVAGVAPQEGGLASGLVNTSRMFGGALGLAILAAVATARTNSELHHAVASQHALHVALTDGFQIAFIVAACFALAGALVTYFGLPSEIRTLPQAAPAESTAAADTDTARSHPAARRDHAARSAGVRN